MPPLEQGADVRVELATVVRRDREHLRVHVVLQLVDQLAQGGGDHLGLLLADHLHEPVPRQHLHDR